MGRDNQEEVPPNRTEELCKPQFYFAYLETEEELANEK
jgi:hypothetical protein